MMPTYTIYPHALHTHTHYVPTHTTARKCTHIHYIPTHTICPYTLCAHIHYVPTCTIYPCAHMHFIPGRVRMWPCALLAFLPLPPLAAFLALLASLAFVASFASVALAPYVEMLVKCCPIYRDYGKMLVKCRPFSTVLGGWEAGDAAKLCRKARKCRPRKGPPQNSGRRGGGPFCPFLPIRGKTVQKCGPFWTVLGGWEARDAAKLCRQARKCRPRKGPPQNNGRRGGGPFLPVSCTLR